MCCVAGIIMSLVETCLRFENASSSVRKILLRISRNCVVVFRSDCDCCL